MTTVENAGCLSPLEETANRARSGLVGRLRVQLFFFDRFFWSYVNRDGKRRVAIPVWPLPPELLEDVVVGSPRSPVLGVDGVVRLP